MAFQTVFRGLFPRLEDEGASLQKEWTDLYNEVGIALHTTALSVTNCDCYDIRFIRDIYVRKEISPPMVLSICRAYLTLLRRIHTEKDQHIESPLSNWSTRKHVFEFVIDQHTHPRSFEPSTFSLPDLLRGCPFSVVRYQLKEL